jgi:DNA-binding MarR family transcriptional regulator
MWPVAGLGADDAGLFRVITSAKIPFRADTILLTWTTNLVNCNMLLGSAPCHAHKRIRQDKLTMSGKTVGKTLGKKPTAQRHQQRAMALRTRPPPRRTSAPAIELGILNRRLGYFARRLQVWIFQDFIRRLAAIDLSPAQFSLLVVIGANAGLSQAELSATLGIERARLVRMLHRLERRGLTQRLPASDDGRRHALRLTREGQRVLARAKRLSDEHEAGLIERFGSKRYLMLIEALREF